MAIKASDLRLGNWVRLSSNISDNEFELVDGLMISHYDEERCIHLRGNAIWNFEAQVKGVPVDSDILIKCGFYGKYKSVHTHWNYKGFIINESSDEDEEGLTIKDRIPTFNYEFKYDIKTLHQLQNLYYALTNTEIEYKP